MVGARNVQSVVMSAHELLGDPGNEYLAISATPAWKQLRLIDQVEAAVAFDAFAAACPAVVADEPERERL